MCGRKFFKLLRVSRLKFEKVCVEESSSSCWEFQPSSLRCVQERFFKLLKVSSCWKLQVSSVSKRVLCQCYKFQIKFQICARKFFKSLRVFRKGFVLWHIAIEWERFQVKSSNITKFFNLKFSHVHFLWIEKLRVFVLAFVKNKMSSFQMESLKVMEKFDGGNFHL